MSPRILAIFTGTTSASLFWLTLTLDVVGGQLFSVMELFAFHDPATLLLAAWAFALLGSIAFRHRSPKLALALAWALRSSAWQALVMRFWRCTLARSVSAFPKDKQL